MYFFFSSNSLPLDREKKGGRLWVCEGRRTINGQGGDWRYQTSESTFISRLFPTEVSFHIWHAVGWPFCRHLVTCPSLRLANKSVQRFVRPPCFFILSFVYVWRYPPPFTVVIRGRPIRPPSFDAPEVVSISFGDFETIFSPETTEREKVWWVGKFFSWKLLSIRAAIAMLKYADTQRK